MLLYNQRGAQVSWEADRVYTWEPYGPCEVPDHYVPLLKGQGFPVDVAPVPPKEKADRAAASFTEDAKTAEIERLRKELSRATDLSGEARRAAEAADLRATAARSDADGEAEKVLALEEQLRAMKTDVGGFEKLLVEANRENAKLKEQLKSSEAGAKQQALPVQPAQPQSQPQTKRDK